MTCTIQQYGFKKNGSWVDSNCSANTTDNVATQANVYFDGSEGSITLRFTIGYPDGSSMWWQYGYSITTSGVKSIDVTVGSLTKGTYHINRVDIVNSAGTILCSATGTSSYCRTLNVVAGGGGLSYDCINRNCLLRQDTQGFFSDYATCNRVCEVRSVDFQVVGNGQMNVSINGVSTVTVFPGETKSVTLRKGNQLEIILIAYVGNHLVGLCDVPQTECRTSLYYNDTVTDANALFSKMVATFAVDTAQYHNVCQNNICTQVSGAGANECSTPGVACTHKVCWNNVCTALDGPGTNECTTIGATCGVTQSWFCIENNWQCELRDIAGGYATKADCMETSPCGSTQKHNICENYTCKEVQGAGTNECSPIGSTCGSPTHTECDANNYCVRVVGIGTNQCSPIGSVCSGNGNDGTWKCNPSNKTCSQTGSGGYANKADCDAVCKAPIATKYNCVSGQCKGPFTTGTYNSYADCVADGCGSGGDGEIDPCDKCTSDQYCLFGQCIKKNDAYMAVGAVVLLMVLTKK